MNEERLSEICRAAGKIEADIWDMYVDTRIESRKTKPPEAAIFDAIQHVSNQIGITLEESHELYSYLHQKMM